MTYPHSSSAIMKLQASVEMTNGLSCHTRLIVGTIVLNHLSVNLPNNLVAAQLSHSAPRKSTQSLSLSLALGSALELRSSRAGRSPLTDPSSSSLRRPSLTLSCRSDLWTPLDTAHKRVYLRGLAGSQPGWKILPRCENERRCSYQREHVECSCVTIVSSDG